MNEKAGLFRIIVKLDSAEEKTDWGFQLNSGKDEFERTVFTDKKGDEEIHYAIINDDDYLTTIEESK